MEQCIVYTRPTGGQSVVFPILSPGQTVEEVAPRLVPAGIDYVITTRQPTPDHFWIDGQWVIPENPPVDQEILASERELMKLSFAQLLIGLVSEQWITVEEGRAWRDRVALPAQVQAVIASLPEEQQFAAETRALAPSEVLRNDPLVEALSFAAGKTSEELDDFFRIYSEV